IPQCCCSDLALMLLLSWAAENFFSVPPITACERDPQCGSGTCCAISLWLRGLRMCTPLGQEGDECHPFSHKVLVWGLLCQARRSRVNAVPFFGKRQHHTCPCLPNLICSRFLDGRYRCSINFKNIDF
uniref:Prokineticin 1 n=1 Tax=Athene cunicularia TaxID=194338 RepID=A0A663LLJ0_ATHCN